MGAGGDREGAGQPAPSLHLIFDRQRELQLRSYGVDPSALAGQDLADYLRTMAWALVDEVSEFMDEVAWKPWAVDQGAIHNREAAASELVDCLHFLVNLALAVGMDADEVHEMYMAKAEKNRRRQEAGYGSRTEKCPACHRAYDDAGAICRPGVCGYMQIEVHYEGDA